MGSDSPGPVPFDIVLLRLAREWGVAPWVVAGEEPTPEVVAQWVTRGLIVSGMEG